MDFPSAAFFSALVVGVPFHTNFTDIGQFFILLRLAERNRGIVADSVYFVVYKSAVNMNEFVAAKKGLHGTFLSIAHKTRNRMLRLYFAALAQELANMLVKDGD
jgi:hypothetical protein